MEVPAVKGIQEVLMLSCPPSDRAQASLPLCSLPCEHNAWHIVDLQGAFAFHSGCPGSAVILLKWGSYHTTQNPLAPGSLSSRSFQHSSPTAAGCSFLVQPFPTKLQETLSLLLELCSLCFRAIYCLILSVQWDLTLLKLRSRLVFHKASFCIKFDRICHGNPT